MNYIHNYHFYLAIYFFFFNDTATTEIYTLSLHDALPIWMGGVVPSGVVARRYAQAIFDIAEQTEALEGWERSEEHTSELQSRRDLVCRLLLEKKKRRKVNLQKLEISCVTRDSIVCHMIVN